MENEGFGSVFNYTVLVGVILGASVLILMYILKLFQVEVKHEARPKNERSEHPEKRREQAQKAKKKALDSRWTGRADKQGFTHPWLLTSLKGHTGQVLDMDFSSNGKYLASCAEEDLDSTCEVQDDSSSDGADKENSPPSSSVKPRTKGLSRRQRKNRKKESKMPREIQQSVSHLVQKYRRKLHVPPHVIVRLVVHHALPLEMMYARGYPILRNAVNGQSVVFNGNKNKALSPSKVKLSEFNPNATEFRPRKPEDSGLETTSGESSDASDVDTEDSSSSFESYFYMDHVYTKNFVYRSTDTNEEVTMATCSRCHQMYRVDDVSHSNTTICCRYHPGKLQRNNVKMGDAFECCGAVRGEPGCTGKVYHVWSGFHQGENVSYDYVPTRRGRSGVCSAYALDCEMVYTKHGLELARVTVVDLEGELIYDSYVKPSDEVLDYNTAFSGITAEKLVGAKTLKQVQTDLLGFIDSETVLIGHALEGDLRVLKMVHYNVVDTAVVFPHPRGMHFRMSLKELVSMYLNYNLHKYGISHNSVDDSLACIGLMLWKLNLDFKTYH